MVRLRFLFTFFFGLTKFQRVLRGSAWPLWATKYPRFCIHNQCGHHANILPTVLNQPVFLLTTKFHQHVQAESSSIQRLIISGPQEGNAPNCWAFGALARARQQGDTLPCCLHPYFQQRTIENRVRQGVHSLGIAIPDIIDKVHLDNLVDNDAVAAVQLWWERGFPVQGQAFGVPSSVSVSAQMQ